MVEKKNVFLKKNRSSLEKGFNLFIFRKKIQQIFDFNEVE